MKKIVILKSSIDQVEEIDPSRPMTRLIYPNKEDQPKQMAIYTREFLNRMNKKENQKEYLFFKADITDDEMLDELPLEQFKVNEVSVPKHTVKMMISKNANTNLQYNVNHLFYLIVKGQQRITLIPPIQSKNLYFYPFLHPKATQSQISLNHPNPESFPNAKNLQNVTEVILKDGEVIYIPPFYR